MYTLNPRRWALALTGIVALLLLILSPAYALPPGGAATSNTPGTNSTVSPSTLKAGDTLSFTLSGFPANEQVYIKIDDGNACPADAAQGACVVHQQKTDGNGNVNGSFVLPTDLAEGEHTLRFLATEVKKDSSGNQIGTEGYSNQSPVFTITGVNEDSQGASYTNVDSAVINQIEEDAADNTTGTSNQGGATSSNTNNTGNSSGATVVVENEKEVYLDASGNEISKEEYDALVAAAATNQTSTESAENTEDEAENTAHATATASASQQAKSTASASATASTSATAAASATQESGVTTEATSDDSQSSVPWAGIVAFAAALVAAGIIVWRRRSA